MKIIQVRFSHDNPAFARTYYRTIDKSKQLVCLQEDFSYLFVWYWCSETGNYEEPEREIDLTKFSIEILGSGNEKK